MVSPILAPAAVLILWSIVVLFWVMFTRMPAFKQAGVDLASAPPGGRYQDLEASMPGAMKHTLILLALFTSLSGRAAELPPLLQDLGLRESNTASRELPGWQKPERVVVWAPFGPQMVEQLQAVAPGVELVAVANAKAAEEAVPGSQALIGICDQSVLEAADQLQWVQVFYSGVENCVSLPGMQAGPVLTNAQKLGSSGIADHAMALTYALVRNFDVFYPNQAKGNWDRSATATLRRFGELPGRTMLVLGLGGIGTEVAQRANALGMRVIATRGSRREGPEYVDYVGLSDEATKLAAEADVVVNALPLTDATRGMIDSAFFDAMKASAYYINVGRGQTTAQADLLAALEAGDIAGAGLDVTDPEPLPADNPLWTAPRVIITPHVAGTSGAALQRLQALVTENLRRYVAGEPLLSVVDVQRGY